MSNNLAGNHNDLKDSTGSTTSSLKPLGDLKGATHTLKNLLDMPKGAETPLRT